MKVDNSREPTITRRIYEFNVNNAYPLLKSSNRIINISFFDIKDYFLQFPVD